MRVKSHNYYEQGVVNFNVHVGQKYWRGKNRNMKKHKKNIKSTSKTVEQQNTEQPEQTPEQNLAINMHKLKALIP